MLSLEQISGIRGMFLFQKLLQFLSRSEDVSVTFTSILAIRRNDVPFVDSYYQIEPLNFCYMALQD